MKIERIRKISKILALNRNRERKKGIFLTSAHSAHSNVHPIRKLVLELLTLSPPTDFFHFRSSLNCNSNEVKSCAHRESGDTLFVRPSRREKRRGKERKEKKKKREEKKRGGERETKEERGRVEGGRPRPLSDTQDFSFEGSMAGLGWITKPLFPSAFSRIVV